LLLLVVAVEEGVVDRPTVWKTDNPQSPVLKAGNPCPPPNSSIELDFLGIGVVDHMLDPLVLDECPVNPMACVPKVIGLRKK
jgi:hypothetical protein